MKIQLQISLWLVLATISVGQDCNYFAIKRRYYIAPDICHSNRTEGIVTSAIYECDETTNTLTYKTFYNTEKTNCSGVATSSSRIEDIDNSNFDIYCGGSTCGTILREYWLNETQIDNGETSCRKIDITTGDYAETPIVTEICVDYQGVGYQWGCTDNNDHVFFNYFESDNCNGNQYQTFEFESCDPDSSLYGDVYFSKEACHSIATPNVSLSMLNIMVMLSLLLVAVYWHTI